MDPLQIELNRLRHLKKRAQYDDRLVDMERYEAQIELIQEDMNKQFFRVLNPTPTKTGKLSNTGPHTMSGVQLSQSRRDEELIRKGYTIEYTEIGKIVSPPKNN